jgi:hypothetical protein
MSLDVCFFVKVVEIFVVVKMVYLQLKIHDSWWVQTGRKQDAAIFE